MRRILLPLLLCGLMLLGCARASSPAAAKTASAPAPTPVTTAAAEKNAVDRTIFDLRCEADDGVLRALYDYFRSVANAPDDFDALTDSAESNRITLYAAAPYREGMLALADFTPNGSGAPDLVYISGGEAQYAAGGADNAYLSYTRLFGDTIVYGKSFAPEGVKTTHITAVFSDGETLTEDLASGESASPPGYIFTVRGQLFPDTLAVYNGGTMVADSTKYADSKPAALAGRFHENLPVCRWLCFVPMRKLGEDAPGKGTEASLQFTKTNAKLAAWAKTDGSAMPDLWRTVNSFPAVTVKSGEEFTLAGFDDSAVTRMYFVNLSLDDGTPEGIAAAVSEAAKETVDEHESYVCAVPEVRGQGGYYMLILDCGEYYYTRCLDVTAA